MNLTTQPEPADSSPNAGLKLFGIGTAGLNILGQLIASGFPAASCVALHSEARSLASSGAMAKFQLEPDLLTGGTANTKCAAEDHLLRMKELCLNTRVVCILAGMGGMAGTAASPLVARAAKEAGALVLALVTLPFDCEGNVRAQNAQEGLRELRAVADLVFCLPNQKVVALLSDSATLPDTFKAANQVAAASVRGMCRVERSDNVMGLPFTDLCRLIRERAATCSFAVASASGPNRAIEVVDHLFAHPMLGESPALEQAEAVAVWFVGGPEMGITEVNRVMELVQKHFPDVPAMMGAALSSEPTEDLLVGLLVAQTEVALEGEPEDTEQTATPPRKSQGDTSIEFLTRATTPRPQSRFLPPPPAMTPERLAQLRGRQPSTGRSKRTSPKLRQTQLPLEIVSKGRFDKSEPTIHKGEDLDVPTYIRRGVALN